MKLHERAWFQRNYRAANIATSLGLAILFGAIALYVSPGWFRDWMFLMTGINIGYAMFWLLFERVYAKQRQAMRDQMNALGADIVHQDETMRLIWEQVEQARRGTGTVGCAHTMDAQRRPPRAGGEMSELDKVIDQVESHAALAREQKLRAEIERLRRELNLLRAVHENAEAEVRQLLDENGSLIAVCREFIDRWPTEEGIDNTIQRARAILLDHDLRSPPEYAVNRALEGK